MAQGARAQWGPHAATREDELQGLDYDRLCRDPPRRDWMVEGCFLKGTVALVAGDGGIGKSLLMQQLATSAVLGRPWLGMSVQPGRALYLGCEDDGDELHRRQWAINRSLGVDMPDVLDAGLDLIPRVGCDNVLIRLARPEWKMVRTGLMDKLVVRCRRTGVQYVIVDTATQTFAGNQNDENQVVAYVSEFRRLAVALQGVVIFTKHPSMSGRALGTGESGNVAWSNSVRARLYLHQHKALGLVLDGMKSNYSRKLEPVPLRWAHGVFERIEAPPVRDWSEPGGYA
jgi:RecA-family ATPase